MTVNLPRFSVSHTLTALRAAAGHPYEDEGVDQLEHALQTAQQARAADSDAEVLTAALLHDIGRLPGVAKDSGHTPHEQAGAEFCRQHCGERVAYLVGQHVQAKCYLVAMDQRYAQSLSPASQRSLTRQGGPMTPAEAAQFESHPWTPAAVLLRRWDDAAKVPGAATSPLDSYETLLQQVWMPDPAA